MNSGCDCLSSLSLAYLAILGSRIDHPGVVTQGGQTDDLIWFLPCYASRLGFLARHGQQPWMVLLLCPSRTFGQTQDAWYPQLSLRLTNHPRLPIALRAMEMAKWINAFSFSQAW